MGFWPAWAAVEDGVRQLHPQIAERAEPDRVRWHEAQQHDEAQRQVLSLSQIRAEAQRRHDLELGSYDADHSMTEPEKSTPIRHPLNAIGRGHTVIWGAAAALLLVVGIGLWVSTGDPNVVVAMGGIAGAGALVARSVARHAWE